MPDDRTRQSAIISGDKIRYLRSHDREREFPAAPKLKPSVDPLAYRALQLAYFLFPFLSGIDKYFHKLVNWDQYVSPFVLRILGGYTHPLLLAMGAFEILMGIGMLFRPRVFGTLLSIYMFIIVVNLIAIGSFFDIALRDFCIGLSALALSRLSRPVRA